MSVNLTDVFQNLVLHISKSHGATDVCAFIDLFSISIGFIL